jgi:hypothetical protein
MRIAITSPIGWAALMRPAGYPSFSPTDRPLGLWRFLVVHAEETYPLGDPISLMSMRESEPYWFSLSL